MATVQHATRILKSHGYINHVVNTEDGLLVTSWECTARNTEAGNEYEGEDDSDDWYEVFEVFPVVNDTVDLSAIRAWLGY